MKQTFIRTKKCKTIRGIFEGIAKTTSSKYPEVMENMGEENLKQFNGGQIKTILYLL